ERQSRRDDEEAGTHPSDHAPASQTTKELALLQPSEPQGSDQVPGAHGLALPHLQVGEHLRLLPSERLFHGCIVFLVNGLSNHPREVVCTLPSRRKLPK